MDCNDFASHWQALVADTVDDQTRQLMGEHARSCRDCGKQWREHRDLCTTIQSVIEDHRLAPNLADDVAHKVYQEHFGTALRAVVGPSSSAAGISLKNPGVSLLLAALAGAMVGYFLAGSRSQSGLSQQMAYAQMLAATSGRGGVSQRTLYNLMGGNPMGGTSLLGHGIPQITSTVRIVFFVFLLLWMTRTKIWEALFPAGVPGGIYVARWGAMLAAILGAGRCIVEIAMAVQLFAVMSVGGGGQSSWQSFQLWSQSLGVMDQLWALAFWLTLMVLLFTLASQITLRLVQQPNRGTVPEPAVRR